MGVEPSTKWQRTDPFTEAGAAYCALKALYWLVYQMKAPERRHMLDLLHEIAEDLMDVIKEANHDMDR